MMDAIRLATPGGFCKIKRTRYLPFPQCEDTEENECLIVRDGMVHGVIMDGGRRLLVSGWGWEQLVSVMEDRLVAEVTG